jgi:serine/threonine protein kinase
LDDVLASGSAKSGADWQPPPASELEPCLPGYRDFAFIDRGGMGAVYSAIQTSLERKVAIKILPPDLGEDPLFVDIFHSEARLLARLQHPNIVAVHDFGRNELGYLYIVMEYVEGTSLLDILQKDGPIDPKRAIEIVIQVCEGIQYAHDRGVIHRDIKPTNILIDDRDSVRVADFGLAQHLHPASSTPSAPSSARMLRIGTPIYAAPEQMRPGAVVDARADLYSLGVTLYEMLAGRLPSIPLQPPSKISSAPSLLDRVVLQAMDPDPARRPANAAKMAASLRSAAARLSTPALSRTISQRPIVSMMSTIIITICMIYLLDELSRITRHTPLPPSPTRLSDTSPLLQLDDEFAVLNIPMSWDAAKQQAARLDGYQLASIHSAEQVQRLQKHLTEQNIHSELWLGAYRASSTEPFTWADGTAWDYENWLPDADPPGVILSELQPSNQNIPLTPAGATPDWIELQNITSAPIDVTGWVFTFIGRDGPRRARLGEPGLAGRPEMILAPGEHRVVICSDYLQASPGSFRIPFTLEKNQGRVIWATPRGRRIQAFDRAWVQFSGPLSLVSDATHHGWYLSRAATPGQPNQLGSRKFSLDSQPRPSPQGVLMVPTWEGRWSQENSPYPALPLLRKIRP